MRIPSAGRGKPPWNGGVVSAMTNRCDPNDRSGFRFVRGRGPFRPLRPGRDQKVIPWNTRDFSAGISVPLSVIRLEWKLGLTVTEAWSVPFGSVMDTVAEMPLPMTLIEK